MSATGSASVAAGAKLLPLKVSGVMPQNAVICVRHEERWVRRQV